MAYDEAKLVQEAKSGIQHAKVARMLEGEMDNLKFEDSINKKKIQLAKMHLDNMKVYFLTFLVFDRI